MTWTIHIAKRAEKQLAKAPAKSRRLLLAALQEMQENPFSGDISRLTAERSTWRRRVGAYRIFSMSIQTGITSTCLISRVEPLRLTSSPLHQNAAGRKRPIQW
jgi:mRNA-degrading endonuclease RelE of RelBE toxin-antitoxin system